MENNKELNNKKRLGRGLGSLLGGSDIQGVGDYSIKKAPISAIQGAPQTSYQKSDVAAGAQEIDSRVWNIAIDKMVPGTYQPRKNFDKAALQELADSIKENGILQPIAVRKRPAGGYEIIAGERRWRAAQLAGLHEVPALIKQISDREALQLALIENIQRENLDPIEESDSYQRLMNEFSLSQQEVAEKVGKERSTIANSLRLILLPHEIKEMVSEKTISVGHAKVLLSVADKAQQIKLAKQTILKNLSVRALEQAIKGSVEKKDAATTEKSALNTDIATKLAKELADQLQKTLGTRVEINYKAGKGHVAIQFYSDDQLTQIYEKLKA